MRPLAQDMDGPMFQSTMLARYLALPEVMTVFGCSHCSGKWRRDTDRKRLRRDVIDRWMCSLRIGQDNRKIPPIW